MSFFQHITMLPADTIFAQNAQFQEDKRSNKLNLGIGIVPDKKGKVHCFEAVKRAEQLIIEEGGGKGYLPIDGQVQLNQLLSQLVIGAQLFDAKQSTCYTTQTLGGTGALYLAARLLSQFVSNQIFLPEPTWTNHHHIFGSLRYNVNTYPYVSPDQRLDFVGMCKAIESMPRHSIILLHGCCHNPTGIDLKPEEWHILSNLIRQKELFPLIDLAYQGFGDGLEKDAQGVRKFIEDGHTILIAITFSKNMGLYGERMGGLVGVFSSEGIKEKAKSHIKAIARATYSNPALHGQKIAYRVLSDEKLRNMWIEELDHLRQTINTARHNLKEALIHAFPDDPFSMLDEGKGMFAVIPISTQTSDRLRQEKGIYVLNGRINLAALDRPKIDEFVKALIEIHPGSLRLDVCNKSF